MAAEQHVRIAAKLYEMRDHVRSLFGKEWRKQIKQATEDIRGIEDGTGMDAMRAALHAMQAVESPEHRMLIGAALVEMIEPSEGQPARDAWAKMRETSK